jgi:hypothetical protein
MPPRVTIAETLKTPPSTMRASFDPRPLQAKPEEELFPKIAEAVPAGAPGSTAGDAVSRARTYVDSFQDALRARLNAERAQIEKLTFEQQVHYLGRVLGLEMKAAVPQWVALVYVKRGLDVFCGPP